MIRCELKRIVEKVVSVKVRGFQISSLSSLFEWFLSETVQNLLDKSSTRYLSLLFSVLFFVGYGVLKPWASAGEGKRGPKIFTVSMKF